MAFNKRKQSQMEQFLNDVLASQDTDMLVVRGKDCKTLFLNNSARARLEEAGAVTSACGPGLAGLFPDLCERCAEAAEVAEGETFQFDVTGPDEHIYAGTIHMVNWLDDKPAKVLTLRDVDEARKCGRQAVKYAMKYDSGSVAIRRNDGDAYAVELFRTELKNVAEKTKSMPDAFINADGNGVTDAYVRYAMPLVGGLPQTEYLGTYPKV